MRQVILALLFLALLAPGAARAQATPPSPAAPSPAAPSSGFSGLWTSWDGASREAMARESDALAQLRRDIATANARQLSAFHERGRSLGERVGEIVREGDCEEGERVAREAGDFALVAAVRAYCRTDDAEAAATAR